MIPSIGRIVHYTLSDSDIATIPNGASDLNTPRAGDVYPMLIVRTWGDTESSSVNGRVFLDGQHDLWVTSRSQGDGAGQWSEEMPVRVVAETAAVEEAGPEAVPLAPVVEPGPEIESHAEDGAPVVDPSPVAESAGLTEPVVPGETPGHEFFTGALAPLEHGHPVDATTGEPLDLTPEQYAAVAEVPLDPNPDPAAAPVAGEMAPETEPAAPEPTA